MASFAALMPLAIIAPKVGPIRFEPSCSESSIPVQSIVSFKRKARYWVHLPVMIRPGTTSRVPLTIAGSARFMSSPRMLPSSLSSPVLTSRFAENAPIGPSWPASRV